jgi:hypothetical protein
MSESNYKPAGTGDTKPMPDRGTSTGMTGHDTHLDGRSIDPDTTNSLGGLAGTDSDPMDQCYATDPAFGKAKGSY